MCLSGKMRLSASLIVYLLTALACSRSISGITLFSIGERGIFLITSLRPFLVFSETQVMYLPSNSMLSISPTRMPV